MMYCTRTQYFIVDTSTSIERYSDASLISMRAILYSIPVLPYDEFYCKYTCTVLLVCTVRILPFVGKFMQYVFCRSCQVNVKYIYTYCTVLSCSMFHLQFIFFFYTIYSSRIILFCASIIHFLLLISFLPLLSSHLTRHKLKIASGP